MSAAPPTKPLWRRREVLQRTGWSEWYLDKLVRCGLVRVVRHTPGSRLMYYRSSIEAIIEGPGPGGNNGDEAGR